MQLWHYTTKDRVYEIISSGEIKLSSANVTGKREAPTLWVSSNPIWENTATKLFTDSRGQRLLTKEKQYAILGLGRIEVNSQSVSEFSWKTFVKNIAAKRHEARKMEISGRAVGGNPNQWFGSTKPIGKEHFLSAEIWNGEEWVVIQNEF